MTSLSWEAISHWQWDSVLHLPGSTWFCLATLAFHITDVLILCSGAVMSLCWGINVKVLILDRCQTQHSTICLVTSLKIVLEIKKKTFSQIYQPEVGMCCAVTVSSSVYLPYAHALYDLCPQFCSFLSPCGCFSCLCLVIVNLPDCLLCCMCVSCRKQPCFVHCVISALCKYSGNCRWKFQRVKDLTWFSHKKNSCLRSCWRGNSLFIFKAY